MRSDVKEERADRRIELDADLMIRVVGITSAQWQTAIDFATSKKMVTPEELSALRIACQLPLKVPSPGQCKKLIALLERLYEEGFKHEIDGEEKIQHC
jgi:hypothetical protein